MRLKLAKFFVVYYIDVGFIIRLKLVKHLVVILLYPLFSLEKKGILISYQSLSFVRLSVPPSCFL